MRRPSQKIGEKTVMSKQCPADSHGSLVLNTAPPTSLLAADADQVGPEDLELDAVRLHVHPFRSATTQSTLSTTACHSGRRTIVVSRSSMMAGPATFWPSTRLWRS